MNSPIANNDIMNSPTVTITEERTQRKCGNCGEFGHNKRKCPYSPRAKEEVEKKRKRRASPSHESGGASAQSSLQKIQDKSPAQVRLNRDRTTCVSMIFTLAKTTCSQRGELFAKSDFHESIRLSAKVLCLRNSESCNLSRSVHLARRAMYTERSLRAATRFLQQISEKS